MRLLKLGVGFNVKLGTEIEIQKFIDERGVLGIVEAGLVLPFDVKRVYFLLKTQNDATRGKHAHKQLKQFFVCVQGSCELVIKDGQSIEVFNLKDSNFGIYVAEGLWRELSNFTSDCVVFVLASDEYRAEDYIHDFEQFIEWKKSK